MGPAILQRDAKTDAVNFGESVCFVQYTEYSATRNSEKGHLSIFAALGLVAANLITCKDGIQQLGLGAVRQHGSRVALRVEASAAEEPKPLPVFQPARQP
jgi:hypothetical protein